EVSSRLEGLLYDLGEGHPTHLWASPRSLEDLYRSLRGSMRASSERERRLHDWALGSGRKWLEGYRQGAMPTWRLSAEASLARNVGFRTVGQLLGGKLKEILTGGDPVSGEAADYFWISGVPVREAYVLTETFGPVALPASEEPPRTGAVGRPLPSVTLTLSPDGEILLRAPQATAGFWQGAGLPLVRYAPPLATGDLGGIAEDGSLRILGRRDELLAGEANGPRSPRQLEGRARADRWIQHIALFGWDRHYLTALVTLQQAEVIRYAREHDILFSSYAQLLRHERIQRRVQRAIDALNRELPRSQSIRSFCLVPGEWSVESGELTPQGSLRRAHVADKYAPQLQALYGAPPAPLT
ncbi:MAG: AMP-binding protein, partial [Bdellovibrionales bacterium]|nr:AMP-binding protein [Bdellovibrionales bacterium]